MALASLIAIVALLLIAFFGNLVYTVDPVAVNTEYIGEPARIGQDPNHPLGTDNQGRDMLARLLAGARISLTVGIVSCIINIILGVGVGMVSGWCYSSGKPLGRFIDNVLMRSVDILYSIPLLLVVVLIQLFARPIIVDVTEGIFGDNVPLLLSPELASIYLALGLINWLTMARLTRGEVLNQANREYVMAAQSLGVPNFRILTRHVLPNCLGPVAVAGTLAIPEAIFVESFLGFIGLGVTAPQASWGTIASDALSWMRNSPHMLILPAIAISIAMLAFNLFGDGLRDAITPSKRQ